MASEADKPRHAHTGDRAFAAGITMLGGAVLLIVGVIVVACARHTAPRRPPTPSFSDVSVTRPLVFERNSGQAPAAYAAIARTPRLDAAFDATGVLLALKDRPSDTTATVALRLRIRSARP